MKIYDVSLMIDEAMIAYPGAPKPKIKRIAGIPKSRTNKSLLVLGSHTGTHADTELHIRNRGSGADKLPLSSFFGNCSVLDLTDVKKKITAADLKKHKITKNSIVLFKTKNSLLGYEKFRKNYVYLAPDGAEYLVRRKVKVLGVDYLSVQEFHSGVAVVHPKIISNMTLFEGLDLGKVRPGSYLFVGLPLKIKGCDGAPARVILVRK